MKWDLVSDAAPRNSMYRSQAINVIFLSVAHTHKHTWHFHVSHRQRYAYAKKINKKKLKELQTHKIETSIRRNLHSTENLDDDNEEQVKEKQAKTQM